MVTSFLSLEFMISLPVLDAPITSLSEVRLHLILTHLTRRSVVTVSNRCQTIFLSPLDLGLIFFKKKKKNSDVFRFDANITERYYFFNMIMDIIYYTL